VDAAATIQGHGLGNPEEQPQGQRGWVPVIASGSQSISVVVLNLGLHSGLRASE